MRDMRHMRSAPGGDVVSSVEYWNAPPTVETHRRAHPFLHWYERWLVDDVARELHARVGRVTRLHVVGCGLGREVPLVRAAFPDALMIVSDIAPAMIEACRANLRQWGCLDGIELRCADAATLRDDGAPADAVFVLDNVLAFVTPTPARVHTMQALRGLLRSGGLLAGSVYNRWGRITKSGYFALRAGMGLVRRAPWDAGDRVARLSRMPVRVHYFTAGELAAQLAAAGLRPRTLRSLRGLARDTGRRYDFLRGDNNLVFVAGA